MFKKLKQTYFQEDKLYNNLVALSRNKILYTNFDLKDTFQNRINLIFIYTSFLFIKLKAKKKDQHLSEFLQKTFDLIFKKIELNMRELGYGDVSVNKNMKLLVKDFYRILLKCENFDLDDIKTKNLFLTKYLELNNNKKSHDNVSLIAYFDAYKAFCVDLRSDSVLKGDLNFKYKIGN